MEKETTSKFQILQKKLSQLMNSAESEQKQTIIEINEMIDRMNKKELSSIFNVEIFNKIRKMIEEKKLTLENAILLLKHVGFWNALKHMPIYGYRKSLLSKRFEKMIIKEEKEKEEKNEKLLTDLYECLFLLDDLCSLDPYPMCVPCLLKSALNKEEEEETKAEAEMAFLTLSNIPRIYEVKRELFLNETKEIIKYHQEHHNLTLIAYQSAWQFLIYRLDKDEGLKEVIANELHFAREAGRELEEMMKCVDWKREKEEDREKETKEELVLMRWLEVEDHYFHCCKSRNEEYIGFIRSAVKLIQAAKDNYRKICKECLYLFEKITIKGALYVDFLLKGGAIDAVLEEMLRPTLNMHLTDEISGFFCFILKRMKGKTDDDMEAEDGEKEEEANDEMEEAKRQVIIMKLLEKMEEEGYEDIFISFHEPFEYLQR